ncbi:MAG: hydantoinase B/oxoprolinase family protein, partial [Planctomycetota bacterium]
MNLDRMQHMGETRPSNESQSSVGDTVECWIDVGGTFTDCFVKLPSGEIRSCKILSSGRVPVSWLDEYSSEKADQLHCVELQSDRDGFWIGSELVRIGSSGSEEHRYNVKGFASGCVGLARQVDARDIGSHHELDSGLLAPVLAVRRLLQIPLNAVLPPLNVRLGTTRGTNALLTRRGAKTVFAVTSPFEDLMEIGDQTRPDLFALDIQKSESVAEEVIGIEERVDASGRVAQPLNECDTLEKLKRAKQKGCESVAICLMHSYCNAEHERRVHRLAEEAGFEHISVSSELAALIELVARAQTTIVDAYLSPVVNSYLAQLVEQFGGAQNTTLDVMTSAGGLVPWGDYSGKDSILSGPAGGVCALQSLAEGLGSEGLIGLDMGGTSTDVTRVSAGQQQVQYESTKAGIRILTPTLPIETVASGGGSICWFDGVSLRVGPQSAGAMPGPACYGRGGPLTITDLNVFLGRVPKSQFPFPIQREAMLGRIDELFEKVQSLLQIRTREDLCLGLRRIANEQMAEAVRSVSIAQGADPRKSELMGFGGAAGQHICEIAESLGMQTIWDAPEGGLLSALGMGLAGLRLDLAVAVYCDLESVSFPELSSKVKLESQQFLENYASDLANSLENAIYLELRYIGTESSLRLPVTGTLDALRSEHLRTRFHAVHQERYGYSRESQPIELVAVRVEFHGRASHELQAAKPDSQFVPVSDSDERWVNVDDRERRQISRQHLQPGELLRGPVTILNAGSTLNIDSGWQAECWSEGLLRVLHLPQVAPGDQNKATESAAMETVVLKQAKTKKTLDPVFRECFGARLKAIATQMGLVLQQTAVSVNVKQRRDYSCAVFDQHGVLLANAPHVPVHLGAMGETVRSVMGAFPAMQPGDVFVTNDPYHGGSHLPDLTLVTPVFCETHERPVMFVANRAHHADIGGVSPGSMSVSANRLGLEGVVIPAVHVFRGGVERLKTFESFLNSAEYPPRNVSENLADLLAQVAANERGVQLLEQYAASESWPKLVQYSEHLLTVAQRRVCNFLNSEHVAKLLSGGPRYFEDSLDDGSKICVRLSRSSSGGIVLDFGGSAAESSSNFNANPSIVKAAVTYVLRCLIRDDLPLNEGVLRAVELRIPKGILNPSAADVASESPAVAAGNVETSQRVVD